MWSHYIFHIIFKQGRRRRGGGKTVNTVFGAMRILYAFIRSNICLQIEIKQSQFWFCFKVRNGLTWITPWKTSPTWNHSSYSLCHFQMFLAANRKEQWGSQRQRLYHLLCWTRNDESFLFHKVPASQTGKGTKNLVSGLSLVITLPPKRIKMQSGSRRNTWII